MDASGHVNNVRFADYLQEARVDLLRAHGAGAPTDALAEGTLVVSQHLQYATPLVFDTEPVHIDVWVAQIKAATFTLSYEIYREGPSGRTTYLTASTVLTPFSFVTERPRRISAEEKEQLGHYLDPTQLPEPDWRESRQDERDHYQVRVRFSDLDVYGHANNVIYLEYFQEARIAMMARRLETGGPGHGASTPPAFVVADQYIEYKRPMVLRAAPYDSWAWVVRLGTSSMLIQAEIRDLDGTVVARGQFALVAFDPGTARSVPFSPYYRALVERALATPSA
jgi:acyl-CoA thioester hydrolase